MMEPIARIKVTQTCGYYIVDSVFEIDGQVARQIHAQLVADILDPADYDANPINIKTGPSGPRTSSPKVYVDGVGVQ